MAKEIRNLKGKAVEKGLFVGLARQVFRIHRVFGSGLTSFHSVE